MNKTASYDKLKAKALKALSRREHGRLELQKKLLQISDDMALIEKILTECEANNWLSEARFVKAYIHTRAQRHYGPRKIRYELEQRGVDAELIEAAFAASELEWTELAEATRQRKFGVAKAESWIDRGKQKQYLYQRGF